MSKELACQRTVLSRSNILNSYKFIVLFCSMCLFCFWFVPGFMVCSYINKMFRFENELPNNLFTVLLVDINLVNILFSDFGEQEVVALVDNYQLYWRTMG